MHLAKETLFRLLSSNSYDLKELKMRNGGKAKDGSIGRSVENLSTQHLKSVHKTNNPGPLNSINA